MTPEPTTDGRDVVLVLTERECGLLALAAAGAAVHHLIPRHELADIATAVAKINEALGNPQIPGYAANIASLRERYPRPGVD